MRIWSDVEYVYRCLADAERTNAFRRAIEDVVKPGHVVLDLGSGSGIMAVLAARAGADRVFAVEAGKYLGRASRCVFDASGYGSKITSLRTEARNLDRNSVPKPDVVICEMVTTGLIGEMQGPVINALKKSGLIDVRTCLVPAVIVTSVALVQTDFQMFGVNIHFPRFVDYFTRSFEQRVTLLSPSEVAYSVDFSSDFSEVVTIEKTLRASSDGTANGLLLTSSTLFEGGTRLENTISYCQPVILPLLPELRISRDTALKVNLSYRMGWGFDSLRYDICRVVSDDADALTEAS